MLVIGIETPSDFNAPESMGAADLATAAAVVGVGAVGGTVLPCNQVELEP